MSKPYIEEYDLNRTVNKWHGDPKRIKYRLGEVSRILDQLAAEDGVILIAVNVNTARRARGSVEYMEAVSKIIDERTELMKNNHKEQLKKLEDEDKCRELDWSKISEVACINDFRLSS